MSEPNPKGDAHASLVQPPAAETATLDSPKKKQAKSWLERLLGMLFGGASESGEQEKAPTLDNAPSPWALINEHSKTVMTLASGFLAITVTFSTSLLTGGPDQTARVLLTVTWVLLILAIAFSVLSSGFLITYLKDAKGKMRTLISANLAIYLLLAAGIVFLVFGSRTLNTMKAWDVETAFQKVTASMPGLTNKPNSKWILQSLQWEESTKTFKLTVTENNGADKYVVSVDTVGKRISSLQKMP